jgi:hypothetical protein
MENNNINTNVAQIILPPDMELRKIKKPKPKTSSQKKEVIKKTERRITSIRYSVSISEK